MREPNFYHGVVWIIFYTKWDLSALYLFHCFALGALLAWALIEIDRQRIPSWAMWFVGAVLFVPPLLWPDLLPLPWLPNGAFGLETPEWGAAAGSGMVAAHATRHGVTRSCPGAHRSVPVSGVIVTAVVMFVDIRSMNLVIVSR